MFSDLIDRKYQILGQTAQSEAGLRSAQAGLATSQTQTNPAEAAAREAQAYGMAGAEHGLGGYYSALGGATTARVPSEIGLAGTQAGEAAARTSSIPGLNLPNLLGAGGIPSASGGPSSPLNINPEDHAMGTSRINAMNGKTSVPGKMPPKGQNTDVTPANLTPGEAVLNRGAAEHLGRDVIDVLNAIGNIKMHGDQGATQGAGPATQAPTDSENGVKGYCMGGVPGYASGSSGAGTVGGGQGSGIDPIAGQGGTWGSEPKFDPRAAAGIPGVPRPAPRPIPLAEGTSQVPGPHDAIMAATHADAARNSQAGGSGEVGEDKPAKVKAGKPSDSDKGEDSTKGYAKGTAKVPGKGAKKPAAGASKITPEMLQQLMALSKGGGGMIPPGQGAPMPMPMPQVAPSGGMGP
jgi:hypothetical protein